MHKVYILKSLKDQNRTYIGITENIDKRLKEHNAENNTGYSKTYAPWRLETYIAFSDKKLAIKFEEYLKAGSGQAFLKRRLI